ncbi:GSCOCG00002809001-RA-CDS, partial [Cotesia congregata]
ARILATCAVNPTCGKYPLGAIYEKNAAKLLNTLARSRSPFLATSAGGLTGTKALSSAIFTTSVGSRRSTSAASARRGSSRRPISSGTTLLSTLIFFPRRLNIIE